MTRPSVPVLIPVLQGECRTSMAPEAAFSTVLGSCVAACLFDPLARVGGMNHFLLPGESAAEGAGSRAHGAYLMELLVDGLMRLGARRGRIEAKLFGGGRIVAGLSDVGRLNADFAARYLAHEGIPLVGVDIGGDRARRLRFWPATGRAHVRYAPPDDRGGAQEIRLAAAAPTSVGEVELL